MISQKTLNKLYPTYVPMLKGVAYRKLSHAQIAMLMSSARLTEMVLHPLQAKFLNTLVDTERAHDAVVSAAARCSGKSLDELDHRDMAILGCSQVTLRQVLYPALTSYLKKTRIADFEAGLNPSQP